MPGVPDEAVLDPRNSAAFIASSAKHVKILPGGITKVAREIAKAIEAGEFQPNHMMLHEYPLPSKEDAGSIDWMFVADFLNFSFWQLQEDHHYSVELHGKVYTGYMALCAALTKALENGIPITSSKYYATISEADATKIFMSANGEPIPLLGDRLKNLHESGQILNERFGGSFANCVAQSNRSASQLLKLIVDNFPSFRDEALYAGKRVSFYKRAQILVADIWGLFKGKGLGQFDDIDVITMFADYRVPQSLVHFGAMEYSAELMELLSNNHMFENGDSMEVEIRGCSIHAVERICDELKNQSIVFEGSSTLTLNSSMIDYFLWEYRRRCAKDLARIPYHKVRCIYY